MNAFKWLLIWFGAGVGLAFSVGRLFHYCSLAGSRRDIDRLESRIGRIREAGGWQ